jgi:hypothetical protein
MTTNSTNEDIDQIKDYRKEKTLELIEKYKDLIDKTFSVADKDLLQDKIEDDGDESQTEQKFLDAIKKRRIALDEVDLMLDKIEKLENQYNPEAGNTENSEEKKGNWTKKIAGKDK